MREPVTNKDPDIAYNVKIRIKQTCHGCLSTSRHAFKQHKFLCHHGFKNSLLLNPIEGFENMFARYSYLLG